MPSTPKTGELLLAARVIDEQQLDTALAYQQARGGKIGEILVSLDYITEQELLEVLSRKLDVPVLAESQVLELMIPAETRAALPRFLAEEELIFPIAIDRQQGTLRIVTHEPPDEATIEGIRIFANVKDIAVSLTTKAAMRKLLAKHLAQEPASELTAAASRATEDARSPSVGVTAEAAPPPPLRPAPPPASPPASEPPAATSVAPGAADDLVFEPADVSTGASQGKTGWDVAAPQGPAAQVIPLRASPPAAEPEAAEEEAVSDAEIVGMATVASPPPEQQAAASRPRTGGRRVLLLHPDSTLRSALAAALATEGHDVAHVAAATDLGELGDMRVDVLLAPDAHGPEARAAAERLVRQNPFLEVRALPSIGPWLLGWAVDPERQFQFLFDLWDLALRTLDERRASERRTARARAELARDLAVELSLPRKAVDEIYLGTYLSGLEDWLGALGFGREGGSPLQGLLERAGCPYQLDDFFVPLPPVPPREGAASLRLRVAAAASAYVATGPAANASVREALARIGWANESPDLASALLRALARRGEVALPQPAAGKDIVVVDTDARAAGLLWLRFVSEGLPLRHFSDGASALEHVQRSGASLILSEVDLPGLGGIELCAAVKSDPALRGTRFFFVSREADPQVILQGLSSGAEDYLIKPVNLELLVIKTKRAIAG